jgi:hypothetical protein
MKTALLTLTLCFLITSAHTQDITAKKPESPKTISIKVPDFADPTVKEFYNQYSSHLVKCVEAIRQKDESKATSLFKNPGEQLVAKEKIIGKDLVKDAAEKQKYMQFAAQVYPYIKEVERSAYYQNMYGRKNN